MPLTKSFADDLIDKALCSLPTGMFICDRNGTVVFINEAYAQYLGLRASMIVGRNITELIPDSGIPGVLASGQPQFGALRQFDKGKTTLLVNRIPVFDDSNTVMGAVSMTLLDTPEHMQALLQQVETLNRKVQSYARRIKSALTANYTLDSIVGNSLAMVDLRQLLLRYAHTDTPVLILGATGTGKELAASALHMASSRQDDPFVCVNCAAIPENLFESEVFGYAPGAFSGAHKDGKIGQMELADQGTLFLDEVGDLPPHAQVKLLRVLEEKRVFRLGASQPRSVDFRLVAATNRDLRSMMRSGQFREDLYYRISPLTLLLPSLHERGEDIPMLVENILRRMGHDNIRITDSAMTLLMRYNWPGNVRELRNLVLRALTLCRSNTITAEDLPLEIRHHISVEEGMQGAGSLQKTAGGAEAHAMLMVLESKRWNVLQSAKALGISRATMYEKMKKYGISRFRSQQTVDN